jgi:hypothetical protein
VADVLENGDIYFFYRPRVGQDSVGSLGEVQRSLIVLRSRRSQRLRLIVVGRKRLPDIGTHERLWTFVDEVAERPEQLHDALRGRTYPTSTRGERVQPPARPVAEGAYALARHGDHTHLAYQLERPDRAGEPQRELNIEPEASYVISVKNPRAPSARRSGRSAPELPGQLQDRFGNRRFIPVDPPDFLDYPGVELVLVAATRDASEELDLDLDAQVERASQEDVLHDLRLGRQDQPVEPLFAGQWR